MSQTLGDVLANRNYSEPPEIQKIKAFVLAHIGITPSVTITSETYVIRTGSASAAGALRMKLHQLQSELGDKKRVIIRIN